MASNPISTLPAAQTVVWTGRSSIASGADGYLDVKNSAGTGFTGVRLGGATSSFPMLKRSSAALHARLADDSGYAALDASVITAQTSLKFWDATNSNTLTLSGDDNDLTLLNTSGVAGRLVLGDVVASNNVTTGGTGYIGFSLRSALSCPSDGYLTLTNAALNNFTGLQFGGTTASFPMLKRSSATLQARLADDSGYAAMATAGLTVNGTATVTPSANSSVLASTGYSLTGSNATAMIDLAGTWNTSGNATLIKANVTNTASGASSNLLDLQVGGTSVFNVTKDGEIKKGVPGNLTLTPYSGWPVSINSGGGLSLTNGAAINFYGSFLRPDGGYASGVLALRNDTTAHSLRVYRTWTDASNYERVALQTGSGYGQLAVESAGTGTANMDLALTPAGTGNLKFGTHSAIGAETVTGYITIKDSGGTTRKLAVVS